VSAHAALQSVTDGLAFDLYNYSGSQSIYIDDLEVSEL
jgi:hypothetical protein